MKYISYVRYALIAISVIIVAMGTMSGNDSNVGLMINWTLGVLGFTFVALIVLSIYSSMKDPKAAARSMMGLLCVLVVLGISFAMSDDTPIVAGLRTFDNTSELLITDTGLYATYIVFALAVVSIALTELYNVFKK